MRILQITSHLNIGGVTSYVLSLSNALAQRGHGVIIASDHGQLEHRLEPSDLTSWPVPLHTSAEFSPKVFFATQQLAARLRQEPVALLHAHTRVAQVVAARLSRRFQVPYVTTWHGFFRPNLGRRLWPCVGDRTIAISEPVREHLIRDVQVPAQRIRLIPNGVNAEHFAERPDPAALQAYRDRHGIPAHRGLIGGIGRLASGGVKGNDLLLAATARLVRQGSDIHVMVVGDGPRRSFLEAEAQRLGIRDRLHFVGPTEDVRVPLAILDVFVFPSRWREGFGLSLIEAMAAGKPVVVTQTGATSAIVEHARSGWLVPPEDPAALADGIAQLLNDPTTASRLGSEARTRIKEHFRLDRMVDAVEAVYRELV